ncbi:MAG: hypothetical protein ACLPP2_02535 [Thermoplasmata archaeon]
MATIWPFWVVLAAVFLALSIHTWRTRAGLSGEYLKWAVWEKSPLTVAGLGKAIDGILVIEMIGFAAAAAAAVLSAFV